MQLMTDTIKRFEAWQGIGVPPQGLKRKRAAGRR